MQTRRGIELDLKQSSYYIDLFGLRFYFSSEIYMNKFKKYAKDFVNIESMKMCNRYKVPIVLNRYFAFVYYKTIEKRGFRVIEIESNEEINHLIFISNIIREK